MTNTELKSRIAELESEVTRLKLQLGTLDQKKCLRTRAARGTREKFERALAKIPARKPLKGDEFPPRK